MTKQQKTIYLLLMCVIIMNLGAGIFGAFADMDGFEGWLCAALGFLVATIFFLKWVDTKVENANLKDTILHQDGEYVHQKMQATEIDIRKQPCIKVPHEEEDGID